MTAFLLRRLLNYIVLLVIATFLIYLLASWTFHPLSQFEGRNPPVPRATIEAKRLALHLDENPVTRYFTWLWDVLRGNFGQTVTGGGVTDELWRRILVSTRLVFIGTILGAVLGTLIGAYQAVRQYKIFDHVATVLTFVLLALPVLVVAPIVKWLAVKSNEQLGTHLLYTGETSTTSHNASLASDLLDRANHLLLPTLVLVVISIGSYSRYMRGSMLDELNQDYIRTARAKGLTLGRAVFKHGFRTALIPMATLFAFSIGLIITGATFTERTFGWYGMGDWLVFGITSDDINITMAVALFSGIAVLFAGFLSDIVTAILDPRVRS